MSPLARKSERLEKRGEELGAKQETTTSRTDGRGALTGQSARLVQYSCYGFRGARKSRCTIRLSAVFKLDDAVDFL